MLLNLPFHEENAKRPGAFRYLQAAVRVRVPVAPAATGAGEFNRRARGLRAQAGVRHARAVTTAGAGWCVFQSEGTDRGGGAVERGFVKARD